VGDQTGGIVQSNITYAPGCINPDPSQNIVTCGSNAANATMAPNQVFSIRYHVGATYTQGQYFQFNSGGGSGISYPIDVSLSLAPGNFSTADADCMKSGFKISTPRIVVGDGVGQCHLQTNSTYYLNLRTSQGCSGPGCVFMIEEPLSMQGTTVSCSATSPTPTPTPAPTPTPTATPPFPWIIQGRTFTSLTAVQSAFSPSCVNIGNVRVLSGFGPCVSGTSGSGTTSSTPPPFPWTIQGRTFTSLADARAAFPNMGIVINGVVVYTGVVIGNVFGTSP
jgi:hypothetical protein